MCACFGGDSAHGATTSFSMKQIAAGARPATSTSHILQAGAQIFTLGDVFRQDLDGDGAAKPRVAHFVRLVYASRTEGPKDFVRAESFAR